MAKGTSGFNKAGGKYSNLSVDSLKRQLSHYQQIVSRNQVKSQLDRNSSSATVRRVQAAAQRAVSSANAEIAQIEAALERAKRRKRRDVPF